MTTVAIPTNVLTYDEAWTLTDEIKEIAQDLAPKVSALERRGKKNRFFLTMHFTYFIAADNGLIKIGTSQRPYERLRQLRTGSPCQLRLITAVPEGYASESELHKRFAAHRSHGEWFLPHPDLVDFISQAALKFGASR